MACSASPGSPHRVAAEHVNAECRDDLVCRIADQHVASLVADGVVFGTHAAWFHPLQSAPSKIRTKQVWRSVRSIVGWLRPEARDRDRG